MAFPLPWRKLTNMWKTRAFHGFPVQIMIYIHGGFSTSFGFFLYVYKRVTPEETYDFTLRYSNVAGQLEGLRDHPTSQSSTGPPLQIFAFWCP
jgi:hypothetical protein